MRKMTINKTNKIKICNLPVAKTGAEIGDYQFTRVPGYNNKDITNAKTHILTAVAALKKGVNTAKESVLLIEGGSELSDILLLYNFFERMNACLNDHGGMVPYCKVARGCRLKQRSPNKLQDILQKTLSFIQKPEWEKEHKDETMAFNWLLAARMPDYLQLKFFKTWVAVDSLDSGRKKIRKVLCGKVLKVSQERFNTVRKFWREIRNKYVHEGICSYNHFVNSGLNGFYYNKKGKKPRFDDDEKRLFNQKVTEQNFDDFKCASADIMENVLTLYFLKIFEMSDIQIKNQIDNIKWHIKNTHHYFDDLNMPKQPDIPTVKFRRRQATEKKKKGG